MGVSVKGDEPHPLLFFKCAYELGHHFLDGSHLFFRQGLVDDEEVALRRSVGVGEGLGEQEGGVLEVDFWRVVILVD